MHITRPTLRLYFLTILALALYLPMNAALAVPSFARQTGMPCQSCHTVFPELTSFGRNFKLHGYTLTSLKQIKAPRSGDKSGLSLNKAPPIAAMLQVGFTRLNKTMPGTQNNDVEFPQQLSLFYAGEITPNIGSFIQITYDQESDQLNWDNTDIRYANTTTLGGTSVVYGVTLNNGPTIQDLWNSTPAWGFPWSASGSAPVPDAATLIDGGLAQDVAGLGGYAMWNDHLYTEVTLYRSAHPGSTQPGIGSENTISGASPYWRLAWQQYFGDNYLEIGTYGLYTKLIPNGVSGDTDDYTDIAFDAQYEHPLGNDLISVHANYIMEERDMNATLGTASPTYDIQTFRLDGNYHFGDRFVITTAYFNIDGDTNLALNPFSRTGQPDSNGYVLQASYLPWQNVKFVAQYTGYNKFNGSSDNYDGSGRNASDNNTFYLNTWLMW